MLNFVVALDCEASPLINHFRLRRDRGIRAFKLFRSEDVLLAVCGIGRERAAKATEFLQTLVGGADENAWLNVGTGGHASFPIGSCLLAEKITEAATGKSWQPRIPFDPPCPIAAVKTVDLVEEVFPDDSVYEMEASGFCTAVFEKVQPGRVHCLKVISDNRGTPFQAGSLDAVSELIRAHLGTIIRVAKEAQKSRGLT